MIGGNVRGQVRLPATDHRNRTVGIIGSPSPSSDKYELAVAFLHLMFVDLISGDITGDKPPSIDSDYYLSAIALFDGIRRCLRSARRMQMRARRVCGIRSSE